MRKISIVIILMFGCGTFGFSQQLPNFSQYMLNGYLINPAVAGSENYADVKMSYRSHWNGLPGAPESFYLTGHMPLGKLNLNSTSSSFPLRERNSDKILYKEYKEGNSGKITPHHGVGISMLSDHAGVLQRTSFNLGYAYHIPLTREMKLSAGASLGLAFFNVNENELFLNNPDDPAFQSYNHIKPTIKAGLMLYSNKFQLGVVADQLLQDELSNGDWSTNSSTNTQFYLTGGYKIALSPWLSILPSTLIKYLRPVSVSADMNVKVLFENKVWLGASYRNMDAMVWMGGFNFNNMMLISYAYDLASSPISRMSNGSHEIVLGLLINNKGKVFSPSDFW